MGYMTVSAALEVLGRYSETCDRDALLRLLNDVRREMYGLPNIQLFKDLQKCFELSCFCADCRDCQKTYWGFRLPRDGQTVEQAWRNERPLEIHSQWREWEFSPNWRIDTLGLFDYELEFDRKSAVRKVGFSSTERDIFPCGKPTRLKFMASSGEDTGKRIKLSGFDKRGREISVVYSLGMDFELTQERFASLRENGGVLLPDKMCGEAVLAQENGRILSVYHPSEGNGHVPRYTSYEVKGGCECEQIHVRYSRKYAEVSLDTEIVETDNVSALAHFAKYFSALRSGDLESKDRANMQLHRRDAILALSGDEQRDFGGGTDIIFEPAHRPLTRRRALW